MKKNWIKFDELRKQLDAKVVLAHYKVELVPKDKPGQFIAECPLPSHGDSKGKTFSINVERKIWQCFACNQHGNILDFCVLMEGKDRNIGRDVRMVATLLQKRFLEKEEAPAPISPPASSARSEDVETANVVVNQPLDFELKTLDTKHAWFASRKLSPATVEHFGLGFCARGFLRDRIAVPLVDDVAQLVGYAGLALDAKETSVEHPRYRFPAIREHDGIKHVFERGRFLYNGFRIGRAVKDLVVVRECHTVWSLWQGGFANVVALMGDECSEDQASILAFLTTDKSRIWILTDVSVESHACATSLLPKVAASRMCRWIKVNTEEEMAPEHPILEVVQRR